MLKASAHQYQHVGPQIGSHSYQLLFHQWHYLTSIVRGTTPNTSASLTGALNPPASTAMSRTTTPDPTHPECSQLVPFFSFVVFFPLYLLLSFLLFGFFNLYICRLQNCLYVWHMDCRYYSVNHDL